jgi:alpha-ketoglutarate-dependent taurine dioxygenase
MAAIRLPQSARPYVLVEAAGERSLDEVPSATIEPLYRAHGAILLRGFAPDVSSFGAYARRFCRTAVVNESPGREPLDAGHHVHSVDGGADAFALHPELSREPWKPDAAFFCCLAAPRSGGTTTICDGIALAAALPRPVFGALESRRLVYAMPTWPSLLRYWLGTETPDATLLAAPPAGCPYRFTLLPDGRIVRHFSRPALHKPMFANARAFGNFLLFARFVRGRRDFPLLDDMTPVPEAVLQAIKTEGDALTVEIEWHDGDVLMLDNTRFMHGRTAIQAIGERRIATFFGYLDFAEPDPEEPHDPVWRREDFVPPRPPSYTGKL